MTRYLILAALLLGGGCVSAEQYAGAAKQAAKDAKDIEAATLEDAACLIGLGAWSRMDDIRKRTGVFYLCVPDADRFGVRLMQTQPSGTVSGPFMLVPAN